MCCHLENFYIFFLFLHFNIDVPMFTPVARALIFKLVLYLCNSNEHIIESIEIGMQNWPQ